MPTGQRYDNGAWDYVKKEITPETPREHLQYPTEYVNEHSTPIVVSATSVELLGHEPEHFREHVAPRVWTGLPG